MSTLRRSHSICALFAVVTLLGWFIATNHCALGLMQKSPLAKAEHAKCCSGKQAPSKDGQTPGGTRECCKSIHAVPLSNSKTLAHDDASLLVVHVLAVPVMPGGEVAALGSLTLHDHGPPRAESFAELVLQRCLPGNAPPFTT